jgi:hypothetical protein
VDDPQFSGSISPDFSEAYQIVSPVLFTFADQNLPQKRPRDFSFRLCNLSYFEFPIFFSAD